MLPPLLTFVLDIMATFGIFLLLTLSLNLDAGYCGIPNFGKVLPMAAGAFTVSLFTGRIATVLLGIKGDFVDDNVSVIAKMNSVLAANPILSLSLLILTLIVAAIVGAVVAYIAARPAIKRGFGPLALLLLAAGEVIRIIGYNYHLLAGGSIGVSAPDVFAWIGEYRFVSASLALFIASILTFFYINHLTNSPLGRMLKAIRDNENAANCLGVDTVNVKLKTIMISSAITSITGALYAFYSSAVISAAYNRATWSFIPWAMMLLGGTANNIGVTIGVFIYIFVQKLIDIYKYAFTFLPFSIVWLEFILYGVTIIVILLYKPIGLIPEKPVDTLGIFKTKKLQNFAFKSETYDTNPSDKDKN